jgi:phosphomannomutase
MPAKDPSADTLIRFGTSGFRGRWGVEYTGVTVRATAQGICDYLIDEGLAAEIIVVGYDSRLHADEAAKWVTEVCVGNGFRVHLASRDTPTPALAYYATVALGEESVAGIINCTASHNPVEWHGIKFSPASGEIAPPKATDAVTRYANQVLQSGAAIPSADLTEAIIQDRVHSFDPQVAYCQWLLTAGDSDARIPIDPDAIARFFTPERPVIIDEMHGAGRGYLPRILDHIGVSYTLLHGTKDPLLGGLRAANPEEPHIDLLKSTVLAKSAIVGVGLDTDADRYGIVSARGVYVWPNQLLDMLTYSLGVDRGFTGRLSVSFVSTHLVDDIAADIPGNEANQPLPGSLPPHMRADEYHSYVGEPSALTPKHSFYVPTGLKNLVLVPQMDRDYQLLSPRPEHWMDRVLLAGEEAAGLTTRGHIPDKDGIWANLLVLDLLARYRASLDEIWDDITSRYWRPRFDRVFVPASPNASTALIDTYLREFAGARPGAKSFAGCPVLYLGGIPGKYAEFRLADETGSDQNFLHIRPSGTEPLIRVYLETSSDHALSALRSQIDKNAAVL